MELSLFLKGVLLGISIAAPVGPIGVLCIRRTLAGGMITGFLSGLGTATADAVYGAVAAFGLTVVSVFLMKYQSSLHLAGGLFLLYLGYSTFVALPATEAAKAEGKGLFGAYTSAFFLTLTNPMTIMSFAAIFAGLGLRVQQNNLWLAVWVVMGVFIGSMLWWTFLSTVVNGMRTHFNYQRLVLVNRFSGIVIIIFGIISISTL